MVTDRLQISEREPLPAIHKSGTAGSNILGRQGPFMIGHGEGERGAPEIPVERAWCPYQSGR
jgi:hypothetical protein